MADILRHAREAEQEFLIGRVLNETADPAAVLVLADSGFNIATRVLANHRRLDGMSERDITDAYERKYSEAVMAGDSMAAFLAEYYLAVWEGLRRDLAEWMTVAQ